jgi:hypothetical protein
MNIYSITLFLHIVGALGFFSAFALEFTVLRQIQHATLSDQARTWMRILAGTRKLVEISSLTALVSGIYMTVTAWRGASWTYVSLVSVVLLILLATILTRPRTAALEKALAEEKGALSQNFHELANHRQLELSLKVRVATTLGIVFLMTVKPGLEGSLLTMAIAILMGLAWSIYLPIRKQAQKELSK